MTGPSVCGLTFVIILIICCTESLTSPVMEPDSKDAVGFITNDDGTRIINGKRSKPGAWPWMAALYQLEGVGKGFRCGGVIINKRYIITAAHCIKLSAKNSSGKSNYEILVGTNTRNTGGIRYEVNEIKFPKEFNKEDTNYHDIALLKTNRDMALNSKTIKAIGLPDLEESKIDYTGKDAVVTGWGSTGVEYTTDTLMDVTVPIVSNTECDRKYKTSSVKLVKGIVKSHICAGIGDRDSCQGDSGGPLMLDDGGYWELLGIVSFGEGCAKAEYPGVYTRVDNFIQWIWDNSII